MDYTSCSAYFIGAYSHRAVFSGGWFGFFWFFFFSDCDCDSSSVADPGFPKGGGANPRGAPTYYLANFFPKTA